MLKNINTEIKKGVNFQLDKRQKSKHKVGKSNHKNILSTSSFIPCQIYESSKLDNSYLYPFMDF